MKKMISLYLPEETIVRIDAERGLVPRNAWLGQAIDYYLSEVCTVPKQSVPGAVRYDLMTRGIRPEFMAETVRETGDE